MKGTIRIPTEQYAYIEVEIEGEIADFVQIHAELLERMKDKVGLGVKEFAEIRDRLMNGTMEVSDYEKLEERGSSLQMTIINELKKVVRKNGKN